MAERIVLPVADRDSEPYWRALSEGHLQVQQCRACGHWTWPPRPVCSSCHGENLGWEPVKGTGEVYSWVVTHQVYAPDFVDLVPYTIAMVRLDEQNDIMIPGRLVSAAEVKQGLRVRAVPERLTDGVYQVSWEAADGGESSIP